MIVLAVTKSIGFVPRVSCPGNSGTDGGVGPSLTMLNETMLMGASNVELVNTILDIVFLGYRST